MKEGSRESFSAISSGRYFSSMLAGRRARFSAPRRARASRPAARAARPRRRGPRQAPRRLSRAGGRAAAAARGGRRPLSPAPWSPRSPRYGPRSARRPDKRKERAGKPRSAGRARLPAARKPELCRDPPRAPPRAL